MPLKWKFEKNVNLLIQCERFFTKYKEILRPVKEFVKGPVNPLFTAEKEIKSKCKQDLIELILGV